jgi:hypothetical protein
MAGVLISVSRRSVNNWRARSLRPARISSAQDTSARMFAAAVPACAPTFPVHCATVCVRLDTAHRACEYQREIRVCVVTIDETLEYIISGLRRFKLQMRFSDAEERSEQNGMRRSLRPFQNRLKHFDRSFRPVRNQFEAPAQHRRSRRSATETGCNCSKSRRASGAFPNSMCSSAARNCARVPHSLSCASRMNFVKASWRFPNARNVSPAPKTAAL